MNMIEQKKNLNRIFFEKFMTIKPSKGKAKQPPKEYFLNFILSFPPMTIS